MRLPLLVLLALPLAGALPATPLADSWISGSDATYWWAASSTRLPQMIASLHAARMNTLFVDAKDGEGAAAWDAALLPRAFAWSGASPVDRAVAAAHAASPKIAVAARFATFLDAHAAWEVVPSARIGSTDWIDPACPEARAWAAAAAVDLVLATGVDEVNLDFVRYPSPSELSSSTPLPCAGGTYASPRLPKTVVVATAAQEIAAAVKAVAPSVTVSGDVFGYSCYQPVTSVGHDAALLALALDHVMPMLYPTGFAGNAGADPYGTVRKATEACVDLVGDGDAVKPWIQGFSARGWTYSFPQVESQIRAVRDAGGSGAVAWWFPSLGTSATNWAALADAMPANWDERPFRVP